MGDGTRFHILLFGGKMNFLVWKSFVDVICLSVVVTLNPVI